MNSSFRKVELEVIREEVRAHLASLPSRIESFLEAHILGSSHYQITIDGTDAGFDSIHGGSLITQFSVVPACRQHGQALFASLTRLECAQFAFAPTYDEFFLSHALDNDRPPAQQAYFFAARDDTPPVDARYALRLATESDAAFVRAESGDFLEPVEGCIGRGELFITLCDGEPVGFGAREINALYDNAASTGMFTLENQRGHGTGAATIGLLIARCLAQGIASISAGCWHYNHASKKTLERAGMALSTRLLKIEL